MSSQRRCYLDIEGSYLYPVEVGLIFFDDSLKLVDARVIYGEIINKAEFKEARKFCHGMCKSYLKMCSQTQEEICDTVRLLVEKWNPREFIANGEDCHDFLKRCGLGEITFRNVILPPWKARHSQEYHKHAFELKLRSEVICGMWCFYDIVHPYQISGRPLEKLRHGSHCALYDALEVAMYDLGKLLP